MTTTEIGTGPVLRLKNGWRCYPLGDGKHLMVGLSGEGPVATVVTLAQPGMCTTVRLGDGLSVGQLIDDLTWIGQAMNAAPARARVST